ncbi:unnamed protein product [Calypogeia fissa]
MAQEDLNAAARAWLQQLHVAGDSLNPQEYVPKFYTEDCVMEFPGHPVLQGHAAIIEFFKRQFLELESIKHTIKHVDALPDRIYQEATIEYVLKKDPEKKVIVVEGLAVFGKAVDEHKMRFFRVYLDPTPLAQRVKQLEAES